jgi:hypothetical protein
VPASVGKDKLAGCVVVLHLLVVLLLVNHVPYMALMLQHMARTTPESDASPFEQQRLVV